MKRVNYSVSNARIGQRTDYDKLTLEVMTNGALTLKRRFCPPRRSSEQMTTFINFPEEDEEVLPIEEKEPQVTYDPFVRANSNSGGQ